MSTEEDASITDAPPQFPAPSVLDQALKARGPQRIPGPAAVPKSRIIERPPVDFAGAAVKSTPVANIDPLGFARAALDAASEDWETIRKCASDLSIDTVTLEKFAKPVLTRAVNRLTAAETTAEQRVGYHAEQIAGVLFKKFSDTRAAEIRAFFRSQKHPMTAMHAALIDLGDPETASAILSAPPFLSGITSAERDKFLELAELRVTPEAAKARAQAAAACALLKRARERMQATIGLKMSSWAGESGNLKALRERAERN